MNNIFDKCGFEVVQKESANTMIENFKAFNNCSNQMKKMTPEIVFLSKNKLLEMLGAMDEETRDENGVVIEKGQNCFQLRLGLLKPAVETVHLTWMMRPVYVEQVGGEKKYAISNQGPWYSSESPEKSDGPEPPGATNPPYTPYTPEE